jgi:homogentisate 1,2-dioxygenase
MVGEDTFRPPYFHRNLMSEYMGLIHGGYDGKEGGGFVPGGASLHNCMTPHGPDTKTVKKASEEDLKPRYMGKTLAFMFETRYYIRPTEHAMKSDALQKDYYKCWQDLPKTFDSNKK